MQLTNVLPTCALVAALAAMAPAPALADGTVTLRGAYYKERSTRVVQPMLDASLAVGDHGTADAHFLVDAITSASASAGADDTAFTERRFEAGGGYRHELAWGALAGSLRLSTEPDYFSVFGGASLELAFAEKNTILALGGGAGDDQVSNAGAQGPFAMEVEGSLRTVLTTASLSQVLSPNLVVSAGYDMAYLRGFQQNPYRTVLANGALVPERHPSTRTRHAIAGTSKSYVPALATTAILTYRFYADSWGIIAHTPEARLSRPLGDSDLVEVGVRYRFHWQRAADFFKGEYTMADALVTDDEKLIRFTSHTVEAKLALLGEVLGLGGLLGESRGELLLSYVDQNNRFGNAITAQVALTVPLSY